MSSQRMRTVLIFAHECAPYNASTSTIGAQRVAQFAKHLPKFGWRAIVICCDAQYRGVGWSVEDAARVEFAIREASPAESVIIPTPSLKWDGLLDRSWRASTRGSSTALKRLLWRKPLTALKQLSSGDYSSAWQPCARRAAQIVLRHTRTDACIGEHSPDAGVMLARWFAGLTGVPWIADFRDPVLRPFPPMLRALYLPRIRSIVSTAAHVVNVNDHWAQLDRENLRRPASSIPNGFDPDEFVPLAHAQPSSAFTIAYCGNLNPRIQTMALFFDALRIVASELPNRGAGAIRFVYRGNGASYVRDMARDADIGAMVDSDVHIPRAQSLQILQSAHALLLLSLTGPLHAEAHFARGLYPAKTFEYFGAKRPILCVPGDHGMLDELIRDTHTGVILRDAAAIAAWILASHREWRNGNALAYVPNDEIVTRFTRERLAGSLATLLDSLLPAAQAVSMPNGNAECVTT